MITENKSKNYTPKELRDYILSGKDGIDFNIVDDIMYHIYKCFMFDWKSITAIDELIKDILPNIKQCDVHIPICLLMATYMPKKQLKNRAALYDITYEKIIEDPKRRLEVDKILANLK